MDSKDQPADMQDASTGLDLASLDTIFGKLFIDPFTVAGLYDHPQTPELLLWEGVSAPAKSVLLIQGTVRLYLTITAQEAFDILNEAAKAMQERGEDEDESRE
ncbi:hypothetical protein LCGC14_2103550 [marine sediment metagenome]|uniref:Uncharacterized protein n=1 Tax=marine sediment metagenome TaxID=412755 RepID=A0A0F9H5M0_9ZZZZ